VLLAEDNFVNQRLMLALLEKQGHRVVVVANGGAAVRAVQQDTFDVVLMDVQMPEMNGLEATRAIRGWELQRGGRVPIVAMTAHAMKGAREDCLRAGMDDYLSKPIQVQELEQLLKQWTRLPTQSVVPSKMAAFDPRPLLKRINGDGVLFRELVGMFRDDCPRMLQQMRDAVAAGNAQSLERAAHLLKGVVGNFAAVEVVRAAQRLETIGASGDLNSVGDASRGLEESLVVFQAALDDWLASHPIGSAEANV
jgi:CheY-like chemotaxis protein